MMTILPSVRKFLKECDMTCSSEGSRLDFLKSDGAERFYVFVVVSFWVEIAWSERSP